MPSVHKSVLHGTVTLPASGTGDIDHTTSSFTAPGLSASQSSVGRPVLFFRASPSGEVSLEIKLNGTVVVAERFTTTASRTLLEIVEHGILQPGANSIQLTRTSGSGSVSVSNVGILYTST